MPLLTTLIGGREKEVSSLRCFSDISSEPHRIELQDNLPSNTNAFLCSTWNHHDTHTAEFGKSRLVTRLKSLVSMIIPKAGNSPGNSGGILEAIVETR